MPSGNYDGPILPRDEADHIAPRFRDDADTDDDGDHDNPLSRYLYAALDADDDTERDYHLREAAQLFRAKLAEVNSDE